MEPNDHDRHFETLMSDLVSLHGKLSRIRSLERSADRFLGEGLALADSVRRAVRRGVKPGPDSGDCLALAAIVEGLERLGTDPQSSSRHAALRAALNAGDPELAARLACELFTALAPADPAPEFAYRAVAIRRRQSGGGEVLPHPETLAKAIADQVSAGLGPPSPYQHEARSSESAGVPSGPPSELGAMPGPIVLASSLAGSTSEIALRVARADIEAPLLRHALSGDIWVFAPRIIGPFSVAIAAEAEDDWWAASPIRYRSYVDGLRAALTRRGIPSHVENAETDAGR